MAFCSKCGAPLKEDEKFCSACGTPVGEPTETAASAASPDGTPVYTAPEAAPAYSADEYDPADVNANKGMSVLAYLGLLALIPFFARKDSKYAQFHAKQGMNLLVVEIAYSIISTILQSAIKTPYYVYGYYYGSYTPTWLTTILWLISIPLLVFAIIGIVNAVQGKAKELPVVGKLKIFK